MNTATPPATGPTPDPTAVRRHYSLRGIVQGVGFRPHFATAAANFPVAGIIGNSGEDVFLHLEGTPAALDEYLAHALNTLPPLAQVFTIEVEETPAEGGFSPGVSIVHSEHTHTQGQMTLMPADVACCPDCLAEMTTPTNRRHLNPLITCTNCGPRLSIITGLPYDRPNTTLTNFPLCPDCQDEYTTPTDRRFHAQPISCYSCGPRLWFEDTTPHAPTGVGEGPPEDLPPTWGADTVRALIDTAHRILDEGGILAVKGIGGFHLIADATNTFAVEELRRRKHRPHKPLAVMVRDLEMAHHTVEVPAAATARLKDPAAPIVLCRKKSPHNPLSEAVAPGLEDIGIVVAYTPLYHLLCDRPLVCTSGNPAGQPLCTSNDQARTHLGRMVEGFLLHDRPIHTAVEDSVETTDLPIRRSRGRAPHPLPLPAAPQQPVILGVGGENKNTLCITDGHYAFFSPHIGDMASPRTQDAWRQAATQLLASRGLNWGDVEAIACDAHPTYRTTALAESLAQELGIECMPIQHHRAHCLSLLIDHSAQPTTPHHTHNPPPAALPDTWVIAACDGTGYGDEHTIYGGEIFTGTRLDAAAHRASHLPPFPLLGGDHAITNPWRILSGINHAFDLGLEDDCGLPPGADREENNRNRLLLQMAAAQLGRWDPHQPPPTGITHCTSTGRLLDAIACLLLGVSQQTYEGHAPMLLQAAATRAHAREQGPTPLLAGTHTRLHDGVPQLLRNLIRAQHEAGLSPGRPPRTTSQRRAAEHLALAAHHALGHLFGEELAHQAAASRTNWVGITGGCAINPHFTAAVADTLATHGLKLHTHHHVPPTDGGLSLGQAVAAWAHTTQKN